jgi:hypothetical protein
MAIPHSTIGSFGPAFAPARLVGLAVNPAYSHTLNAWLPTMLSRASRSSVTLWEETAPVKLTRRHCPPPGFTGIGVRILINEEWCFTLRLQRNRSYAFKVSHLRYASLARTQYQLTVKVHRVFPSYCGQAASSPPLQFRRDPLRDSRSVVTRFVQVGTYPTRNFATLGPL